MSNRAYPQFGACEEFFSSVKRAMKEGATFDSAEMKEELEKNDAPEVLDEVAEAVGDHEKDGKSYSGKDTVIQATMDGIAEYQRLHGHAPKGDVIMTALQSTLGSFAPDKVKLPVNVRFDDASSSGSGAPMQVNRAMVAIYRTIADAVPFAGYIPMTGGFESRIIIQQHEAANECGSYKAGQSMDGINAGGAFMDSARVVEVTANAGAYKAILKLAEGDDKGAPLIASATEVSVNGIPVGGVSVDTNGQEVAPISGQVHLAGQTYVLSGSLQVVTGIAEFKFSPDLPAGASVEVIGHINFEHAKNKDRRPAVQTSAKEYRFRATFMSGIYRMTQEAKAQFSVEVGVDPGTEAMYQLRMQSGLERHRYALQRMYRVGKSFVTAFNMMSVSRQNERSRVSIWSDVLFPLAAVDQDMVERTNGFGIGVLYVGGKMKAEIESLPPELFKSSGLPSQPGVYRIGRLYDKYDVYYVPGILKESASSAEILCIGVSDQVARNPIIMGDVAGPMILPLGTTSAMEEGHGYFQALTTIVNKHLQSAVGAAVLELTGL